ncbi:MAG: hypothetical protein LBG19_12580 [Prevotellaceae bacterium]|jgi:hypothetical protein|nr:hypothetical protein [Prevotellaceae bacterium]
MEKKLSFEQMENLQGGKFWGDDRNCNKILLDNGRCAGFCITNSYIFWIKVSTDFEIYPEAGGGVPCHLLD